MIVSAGAAGHRSGTTVVPLPYSIPPVPYLPNDLPWSNDVVHQSDAPDRHGFRSSAPPRGGFYGARATGRELAEREARRR